MDHQLRDALQNDKNEFAVLNTWTSVRELTHDAVSAAISNSALTMQSKHAIVADIMSRLSTYRLADELDDLRVGKFIRWIFKHEVDEQTRETSGDVSVNIKRLLPNGAIVQSIDIFDHGIMIACKNMGPRGRYFSFRMDDCVIFQHLSRQEQMLLDAIDVLCDDNDDVDGEGDDG